MALQSDWQKVEDRLLKLELVIIDLKEQLLHKQLREESIGPWLSEDRIIKITGLGKTSLYKLRKECKVTYSTILGRGVFYKLEDFERLLKNNAMK